MEFLDRLRRLFPDSDLSAFEGYLVPDCGLDANTKAVLLCESPHVDEVGSAPLRPLAGKSGKSVARVFVEVGLVTTAESNRSIGELVSAGCTELEWLGLMNACQLPLQEKAYEEGVRHEHGNLIGDLQAVRTIMTDGAAAAACGCGRLYAGATLAATRRRDYRGSPTGAATPCKRR